MCLTLVCRQHTRARNIKQTNLQSSRLPAPRDHWGRFLNPSFAREGIFLQSPTLFGGGITFNTVNQITRKCRTLFCLDIYYFRFASDLHFFQIFIYPRDDEFPREMLRTNKNSLSRTEWKLLLDIKIFVRVECKAKSKHLVV